ncbi:MAG: hypothetical protein U0936_02095 [Planctomycetaceae bacterium]
MKCVARFQKRCWLRPVCCWGLHAQDALPETVEFNRDIRPDPVGQLRFCSRPRQEQTARPAFLMLAETGLHGDGQHGAIVAGKPDDSEMIKRILIADPEQKCPGAFGKVTFRT